MRKFITYIIIITITFVCSDQKKSDKQTVEKSTTEPNLENKITDRKAYVTNPKSTDSLCKSDILKAKSDIDNGKFVYVQAAGLGFGFKRYESDLKKLCKEKGLEYDVDLIGCVVMEGQTQGCYGAYMDKALIDKFGSDFKEKLNRQADSLFLVRILKDEILIFSWDCDEKPEPILENKNYLETTLDVPNLDLKRTELGKTWPAIDLSFIIERNGTISKFYSDNFIPRLKHNEKFKDELYKIAVNYIKTNYPNWKSGKIKKSSVRTDHNLRITFIGKM
ncbi:hypothetical protein [Aquimarina longa]|uniref:hypothetical protein n=1 Tax=Aquimarina longa TaxID=1080221 RepID=UPI0007835396|nr:hypothetical protein [Aquimarina longa]